MSRWTVVALVSALALVAIPSALAESTYTDPAGDSGAAPDVTQVTVSDAVGRVAFRVASQLVPDSEAAIRIDSNSDGTNDWMLVVGVESDGSKYYGVHKWTGAAYAFQQRADGQAISVPGGFEISIPQAAFGLSGSFAFDVEVTLYAADAVVARDWAPDGTLPWTYTLTKPAPPVAPVSVAAPAVKTVTAVVGAPVATPARPVAGRPLTLTFAVTRSDTGGSLASGRALATATVGGIAVPARVVLSGGKARVTLTPPKRAKGTRLSVRLDVTIGGSTTTRRYTTPIG
jgi:hypothetical protein